MNIQETIKDFVGHIANKEYSKAKNIFSGIIGEKALDALEKEKIAVAEDVYEDAEDAEELDELSRKTLASYVQKAGRSRIDLDRKYNSLDKTSKSLGNAAHDISNSGDKKSASDIRNTQNKIEKEKNKVQDKDFNRHSGINKALKKLSK